MKQKDAYLSKRDQQLFDLLNAHGELTAAQIGELLPDNPSNSSVRTLLKILSEKGWLEYRSENGTYVYRAAADKAVTPQSALSRVVETLFKGSAAKAATALLGDESNVSQDELSELEALIAAAKQRANGEVQ